MIITNIVRVLRTKTCSFDDTEYNVCVPIPAMDQVKEKISQVKYMSRIHELFGTLTVPHPGNDVPLKKFSQERDETAFFAESEFFKIFDFKWLAGDANRAILLPVRSVNQGLKSSE